MNPLDVIIRNFAPMKKIDVISASNWDELVQQRSLSEILSANVLLVNNSIYQNIAINNNQN